MQTIMRHTVLTRPVHRVATLLGRRSQDMQTWLRIGMPQGMFAPPLRGKMHRTRIASTLLLLASISLMTSIAEADLHDCQDLYVGRIVAQKGYGLWGVQLLQNPGDASGSYWINFDNWSAEEKTTALALLTTAKIARHRVNIATYEADGCSLATAQHPQAAGIALAIHP